jgi:hypothetical protein
LYENINNKIKIKKKKKGRKREEERQGRTKGENCGERGRKFGKELGCYLPDYKEPVKSFQQTEEFYRKISLRQLQRKKVSLEMALGLA